MPDLPREIRGVMIPVTGGRVLLPNATVAEIPGAAHYPWVDTPEQFRETVASFLR